MISKIVSMLSQITGISKVVNLPVFVVTSMEPTMMISENWTMQWLTMQCNLQNRGLTHHQPAKFPKEIRALKTLIGNHGHKKVFLLFRFKNQPT